MAHKPGSVQDFGALRELLKPHIESFDYMADQGLQIMFQHIAPVQVIDPFTSTNLRNILFFFIYLLFIFELQNMFFLDLYASFQY
ncbi:hypothetical protein Lalb_Chr03g0032181 [Lupinus albus]|uniref:Uncharacterized protein n=1 Tax=Lupinus albus TaxID=3870 RepID=A0A6A4QUF4_LUPAL|nr:hypothetical protein Lalb_Chr03g0032181 [Lupinus albus]